MTTDELKFLLRDCREHIDTRHIHYGVMVDGVKVENVSCDVCEVLKRIDAALAEDFAVVPVEPSSDAMNRGSDEMLMAEGRLKAGKSYVYKEIRKAGWSTYTAQRKAKCPYCAKRVTEAKPELAI